MFKKERLKQKRSRVVNDTRKGSVLAFTLIILSMMLTISISTASVNIIQKKNASSTQFSVQAYQVADGGALWALKKLNTAIFANAAISSQFSSCSNGVFSDNTGLLGTGTSFDVDFLKVDGTPNSCSDDSSLVATIKSTGRYRDNCQGC